MDESSRRLICELIRELSSVPRGNDGSVSSVSAGTGMPSSAAMTAPASGAVSSNASIRSMVATNVSLSIVAIVVAEVTITTIVASSAAASGAAISISSDRVCLCLVVGHNMTRRL